MDIAAWLRDLGFAQYEGAFRDNDIDADVLRRLTADDLRELGVASIGHRRRLLDAIALLSEGAAMPTEAPAPAEAAAPAREAERRQITVMFCDLVGSTALASRLDPEDLREVIGAYHRVVTETVGRFAGFVAKYMGDGVLVYFGYPEAHEDDAERAVRAELALRRWQQAKTGEGWVVLVSGEPGIGKSRLTAALSDMIADEPHTRLRWFCSPHHQDSVLYPTIARIEAAAGFARGDAADQRR